MAIDASLTKIEKIEKHPNADSLDVATVSNYSVIIKHDDFKVGDVVLFVRDDAKLIEYEQYQNIKKLNKLNNEQKEFSPKFTWQIPYFNYLGGNGKVRTVKIRGIYSSGFLYSNEEIKNYSLEKIDEINNRIMTEDNSDLTMTERYLYKTFGITHWISSTSSDMSADVLSDGLPFNIRKSNEENYQNLNKYNCVQYGEIGLFTRKMDGTSCTIVVEEDSLTQHICKRNMELKISENDTNVYQIAATPVIKLMTAWVKKYNKTLVCQGEICCSGIQKFPHNIDRVFTTPTFNLFRTMIVHNIKTDNPITEEGFYKSDYHFLNINEQIKTITGETIRTVPIIGEKIITKEILDFYRDSPKTNGEGVVVNHTTGSFKAKSLDYLNA